MATKHGRVPAELSDNDQKRLIEIHERYRGDQDESKAAALLAEQGHPNTPEYRRLREFFDALGWCANMGAKYYSYGGEREKTEYWAPNLGIRRATHGGLTVYPREWERFEAAVKDAPLIDDNTYWAAGSWIITTEDQELFEDFREVVKDLERGLSSVATPSDYDGRKWKWDTKPDFTARIFCQTVEEVQAVKAILDDHVQPLAPVEIPEEEEVHG